MGYVEAIHRWQSLPVATRQRVRWQAIPQQVADSIKGSVHSIVLFFKKGSVNGIVLFSILALSSNHFAILPTLRASALIPFPVANALRIWHSPGRRRLVAGLIAHLNAPPVRRKLQCSQRLPDSGSGIQKHNFLTTCERIKLSPASAAPRRAHDGGGSVLPVPNQQ